MRNYVAILLLVLIAVPTISVLDTTQRASASNIADYVVITTNYVVSHSSRLMSFIGLKEADGYSVRVVTETDYGNLVGQPPNGIAEKIRQWLKDHYQTFGTKYVLLIGNPDPDVGDIPMKMCWPGYDWPYGLDPEEWHESRAYPTDFYYADLHSNWDLDSDQIYGEFVSINNPVKPSILSDKDTFSIRWTGYIQPNCSEVHDFRIFATQAVRLYVDDDLVIDHSQLSDIPYECIGFKYLEMDNPVYHTFRLEYCKNTGDAFVTLEWGSPGQTNGQWKSPSYYSERGYMLLPGLIGAYYENMDFTNLAGTEIDNNIRYSWCTGDRGPGGIGCSADVYVGRIPVYNNDCAQLDDILRRMINYETQQGDVSWRRKILLPAEIAVDTAEAVKTDIANPNGFTSFTIYNEPCPPCNMTPLNPQNVENEWKNGYGVVTWFAHGLPEMAEQVFDGWRCANLDDSKPSFVFQSSCLNGYPEASSNLAYSLLKHGAISTVGATRVSWPPGSEHFAYLYTKHLIQDEDLAGTALSGAKADFIIPDDSLPYPSGEYNTACNWWEDALAFNLYGDPACSPFNSGKLTPIVRLSTRNLEFKTGTSSSQQFTIYNDGTADLHVSQIVPSIPTAWLYATPAPFTVHPGENAQVTVTVNANGLTPGIYDAYLDVFSSEFIAMVIAVKLSVMVPGIPYSIVRGQDNRIYYQIYYPASHSWTGWSSLPGTTCDSPAAAVLQNELHVVVRGMDGSSIWHGYVSMDNGVFSGWTLLSGSTPSAPTLASNGTVMCLVVRGEDNRVYYRTYSLGPRSWAAWNVIPTGATCDGPAATMLGNALCIVVRGFNPTSSLWSIWVDPKGSVFGDWVGMDGVTESKPVLTAWQAGNTPVSRALGSIPPPLIPIPVRLIVRGTDNRIYMRNYLWISDTWGAWYAVPTGTTPSGPSTTTLGDSAQASEVHIVVCGMDDSSLWHCSMNSTDLTFSDWTMLDGSTPSQPALAG